MIPMRIMMRRISDRGRRPGGKGPSRGEAEGSQGPQVRSARLHRQQQLSQATAGIFDALRAMKAEGLSQAAMAERLETQGFVTKQGKRLHQTQVGRLLADMEKQPE